jgi:hypothetical protein
LRVYKRTVQAFALVQLQKRFMLAVEEHESGANIIQIGIKNFVVLIEVVY